MRHLNACDEPDLCHVRLSSGCCLRNPVTPLSCGIGPTSSFRWINNKRGLQMPKVTTADAIRRIATKLLCAALCGSAGGYALHLALDMVSTFGEGMGIDERSQKLYGSAHVAVHLFGTLCAVLIVVLRSCDLRNIARVAIGMMVLCGAYGVINMIGFSATNRLAVAEAREAANAAARKDYENKRAAIQADIDWAQSVVVNEINPRERKRLFERIDAKIKELAAVQPPALSAAAVLADPQATLFQRLFGWDAESWRLTLPIPIAVLLYCAEGFAFMFAAHLMFAANVDWQAWRAGRQAPTNRFKSGNSTGRPRAQAQRFFGGQSRASREEVRKLLRQRPPLSARAVARRTGWPRQSVDVERLRVEAEDAKTSF
jgi:hypothetical protein